MDRKFIRVAAIAATLLFPGAVRADEVPSSQTSPQRLFFENLRKLCGQQFEGATEFPQDPKHEMVGKKLVISVGPCSEKEIRIPFRVADDQSRTWVLTLGEKGLLLKHDHRHADGSPDKITMYGGWATPDGTATQQRFGADEETAKLIPEAATNVWKITIDDEKQQLTYSLERHAQPRYKAVFDLKNPR